MDTAAGVGMTLRSIADLVAAGFVAEQDRTALDAVAARYAIAVTPEMAALIDLADSHDPIARQFVPTLNELHRTPD